MNALASAPYIDCALGVTSHPHATRRVLIEPIAKSHAGEALVFNALTGAVDLFSARDLRALISLQQRDWPADLPDDFVAQLKARGYVFSSAAEEESFLENSVRRAQESLIRNTPTSFGVCPTLACNLDCGYCFEGASRAKPQGVMSVEIADLVFAAIGKLIEEEQTQVAALGAEPVTPVLSLFGGEPLLPSTARIVAYLVRRAADAGMLVAATTNGVNIRLFEKLLSEYRDIITTFQITLDGPKEIHDARRYRIGRQGTFDEIVRGIDAVIELGIEAHIRVNIDRANMAALPDLCHFVADRGWADHPHLKLMLAPVTSHAATPEGAGCGASQSSALSEIEFQYALIQLAKRDPIVAQVCRAGHLRHLEHLVAILEPSGSSPSMRSPHGAAGPRYWYCEAGTAKHWMFTPDGLVYTCTESVGKPQNAVGCVSPEFELWKKPLSQWIGRTILSHPKCRACAISTLCGGGCHFAAREHDAGQSRRLLQIELPTKGRRSDAPFSRAQPGQIVPAHKSEREHDPYCAGAEEIVRTYLSDVGNRLFSGEPPKEELRDL